MLRVQEARSVAMQRSLLRVVIVMLPLLPFYTECEPKWRLSFVRLDYEMKIEQGKLKTTENITPAKRYSFLVGRTSLLILQ